MDRTALLKAIEEGTPAKVRPLAKAANFSANALYGAVERGEVRSIRVGRAIRIPPDEAKRLLGLERMA
jgi:hypothetical protein